MSTSRLVKLHEPGPSSSGPTAAHSGYLVDLSSVSLSEGGGPPTSWIQVFPYGSWSHPLYGDIDLDQSRAQNFADNFKNNVRGQDLPVNYNHNEDKAQGAKAAGWFRDVQVRSDGLWALVEWTKDAAQAIRNREWRYFSPEFVDKWKNPRTGKEFQDVLFGGGLTNQPFLKGIVPINLSEMFDQNGVEHRQQEGKQVDRKQICKLLGLSEDASDEDITRKLSELTQTTTQLSELLDGEDNIVEAVKKLKEPESNKEDDDVVDLIKKLGEDNPFVKKLAEQVEGLVTQNKELSEQVVKLTGESRESAIEKKLAEVESGSRKLTPAQRDDFKKVLLSTPDSAHESVYKLAEDTAKNSGVELKERGGALNDGEGGGEEGATKRFNDRVAELMEKSDGKMTFGDAVEAVSSEDPQLFAEYRSESYIREEM